MTGSTTELGGPVGISKADGGGWWGCRDQVVILLVRPNGRHQLAGFGSQSRVDAGKEFLRSDQAKAFPGAGDGNRRCDLGRHSVGVGRVSGLCQSMIRG